MSSSSILRPEILIIGNRSYRINPSSLPSLESIDNQQHQVYREEEEADYYIDKLDDDDDDEPSCIPQQKNTTIESEEKPQIGITDKIFLKRIRFSEHTVSKIFDFNLDYFIYLINKSKYPNRDAHQLFHHL
jgi:hypothetical protein